MNQPEGPRPQVSSAGARHFIRVAQGRSAELHAYLRQHHVRCDPPDPCSTGLDVIELDRGADLRKVQALLDGWA